MTCNSTNAYNAEFINLSNGFHMVVTLKLTTIMGVSLVQFPVMELIVSLLSPLIILFLTLYCGEAENPNV